MPRLSIEPHLYPNDLLANDTLHQDDSVRWWVMHTRPRQEKCLARELYALGVQYFLPIVYKRVRLKRRVVVSSLPLFPGYVAVHGDEQDRLTTLETGRVVNSLGVGFQKEFQADLHRLHRLVESGLPVTREERLAKGDRVLIKSGPLAGLEGEVIRSEVGRRFLIQVNFIQRGASVLADDFDLEFIG